jgi:hypothetical protein
VNRAYKATRASVSVWSGSWVGRSAHHEAQDAFANDTLCAAVSGHVIAGLGVLPPIPVPKLTAAQAMAIAQAHLGNDPARCTLVGVDWHKAADFQPRFAVASRFLANDHPDDYSWFVTYVYKDDTLAPLGNATQQFPCQQWPENLLTSRISRISSS